MKLVKQDRHGQWGWVCPADFTGGAHGAVSVTEKRCPTCRSFGTYRRWLALWKNRRAR